MNTAEDLYRHTGYRDAIELLSHDHDDVKAMFQQYKKLKDEQLAEKKQIAEQICTALTLHATIEEEIFYPAAQSALKDPDMIGHSLIEHAQAKQVIADIRATRTAGQELDTKVKALDDMISHHVKEEESTLFPKVRKTGIDLVMLGEQLAQRKQELAVQGV